MGSEHQQLIDFVHKSAKEDYKDIVKILARALTMVIPSSEKKFSILTSKDFTLG